MSAPTSSTSSTSSTSNTSTTTALPAPPSWLSAVALHAQLHLRRTLRFRRIWPALLLIALVGIAGGAIARVSAGDPLALLAFVTTLGTRALGLIALGFGTRALRADADHGALSAFLLRPHAASALPLGRYLATALIVSFFGLLLLLVVQCLGFVLAAPLASERLPFIAFALIMAAFSYTALFFFFAAIIRPAAAAGLAWLVLIDLGLGSASLLLGRLTPGPSVAILAEFDPDLSLFGTTALPWWFALCSTLTITILGVVGTHWRFRGDAPE